MRRGPSDNDGSSAACEDALRLGDADGDGAADSDGDDVIVLAVRLICCWPGMLAPHVAECAACSAWREAQGKRKS